MCAVIKKSYRVKYRWIVLQGLEDSAFFTDFLRRINNLWSKKYLQNKVLKLKCPQKTLKDFLYELYKEALKKEFWNLKILIKHTYN